MTCHRFFRYVLFSVLTFSNLILFGQSEAGNKGANEYTITKRLLSIDDGLASHEVFCGLQDSAGFLWFGTRNGLNRYDGKNCLLFTRQRDHLQDDKVVQLAKDGAGNLFIEYGSTGFQLTTNGKIDVMNTVTHEVKTLGAAFPGMPFNERDVYWIANDGTDEVNFLTALPFRLWKYSPKHGFKLRYQINDWEIRPDVPPFVDYRITGPMCVFAQGKALVKFFNQSTQYLISDNAVVPFRQNDALRSLPLGYNRQKDLLIAYSTARQPNKFDIGAIGTLAGKSAFPAAIKQVDLDSIKGKYWYQVVCSADGLSSILYIGTDAIYFWKDGVFLKLASRPEIKNFENLFLYQLFPDRFGNLWLCTSTGVFQLKIERNRFKPYFTTRQQSAEPNNQVRGIYADENGLVAANVWMHLFEQQGGNTQNVAGSEIKYALIRHDSKIYAGGFNLFGYDDRKNTLTEYPGGPRSEIWSMHAFNDSLLVLGRTEGFSSFNTNTKKYDSLQYASHTAPAKFVYRFFKDNTRALWAVAENGLYQINPNKTGNKPQWLVTRVRSSTVDGLSMLDAYIDPNGIFWLATNGEGLYRWDKKANTFQQFNIAQGFPSDVLYRIEPDAYNNLWISSDYGLIRFNKRTFSVNTYTTANGITNNEFNRTSSFNAADGRLFFGGLDGLIAFNPKDFATDTGSIKTPLRITTFNQFVGTKNKLVNKTTELLTNPQITLAPHDQFFTLEFQLLDFAKDESQHYAYKIEGVDKDWNYINENSIRISGLPYGKFTLRVKAQNREGAWSKSELVIPVSVLKPFYLAWWFIALVAIGLVLAIYWIITWRTRQLAAEKIRLEQTVNERTAQLKQSLSEQAELLTVKDVLMKEIHHRVKNNLQVISGLLELQSNSITDETAKDALREGRDRVRSIALIHQNLYQFEHLSSIELKRFVNDLCRQVKSVFKNSNKVEMSIDVPVLYLDIDSAVPLGLILNELLTNSFKYAFDDGKDGEIRLQIDTLSEGSYRLNYRDNGPGLPVDFDLNHATTLGMQLINDLGRQIGGKVQYAYKNGASFIINFTNRDLRKKQD